MGISVLTSLRFDSEQSFSRGVGPRKTLMGFDLSCSQEPRSKEGSEYFDSRSDGLNLDPQGPSQSCLWSVDSMVGLSQRSQSAQAMGSDPLRQNIYENFMRELEMSRTHTETADSSSETAETSSESLSSWEQLDLLFEKEQGVVRKAGWLFFKPLVTLQKERKLELVARRKWKQYWVTLKGECSSTDTPICSTLMGNFCLYYPLGLASLSSTSSESLWQDRTRGL